MRVIITGGAGFIGCNFIKYIMSVNPHWEILCIDKLTYAANLSVLEELKGNEKFSFIKADICDREEVDRAFAEFEPNMVVNFAAESHVDRSIDNPDIFLKSNFIGVGVLLDACVKYGNIRFHQISTDEVYGDVDFDEMTSFAEASLLNPSSPYSASKASADLLVLSYGRTYNLPVTISRCANNYGKYQHEEKLIPKMILNAVKGEKLPVYGEGKNIREWIHVNDHCRGIELILKKGKMGEVYNIGGTAASNIALVKRICDILNVSYDKIEYVTDRPGHDRKYSISSDKINSLGYTETVDFETGISDTVNWYKSKL